MPADSPSPNPRDIDFTLRIKLGRHITKSCMKACGPLLTKILGCWQGGPGLGRTGYWAQRNSDNCAYYTLAENVMSMNENNYQRLPMIRRSGLTDAPMRGPRPGTLAEFFTDGSNFYLNTTDDVSTFDTERTLDDYPGCFDDENSDTPSEAGSAININGFAPASAYPDDYNIQVSFWILRPGHGYHHTYSNSIKHHRPSPRLRYRAPLPS